MGKESRKIDFFFIYIMCLRLYDHQVKASRYRKGLTYLKNRANIIQNQTLHSQKLKRWGHKHKTKGNHTTKKKKRIKEKHRINWITRFKMAINTYLSIITLNVNGLNAAIKRHRVADWIKKSKSLQYAAYKRLTLGQRTHINSKWGDGKRHIMGMEKTGKQE